ncbi:hypothetical protein B0T10DRAFT_534301 [Thelonectria olida]|uniref:Uncharacterized protein n=1 Tax=Thelonectria olida TaxID=1576542 RepID=A0A9P8VPV5_9HYPO|nr:hypothetical protein B0T10DRAFT_534301 [Thelonectria olida]
MGHFTSSTARIISSRTEVLQLWQTVIPEEAITCPFLVHGMLALSAMHLASLRSSQRRRPEASGQVFAMASLVVLLGLAIISDNALPNEDTSSKNHPAFTDVISIFTIIRGLEAILKYGTLIHYRAAIVGHTTIDGQDFELPANLMTDCLDSLLADDKSAKQPCLEAIDWLQSIYCELLFLVSKYDSNEEVNLKPAYVVKWFVLVSLQFVAMLRQANTAALVILGDFLLSSGC